MATTTCGKCGGQRFEVKPLKPANARFELEVVQCASCGCALGLVDDGTAGKELTALRKDVKEIGTAIGDIRRLFRRFADELD